ncbi:MAG: hypothetical protein Q7J63_14575 [Rhodonellum sp.]|nr:hypothetical protein [Rhodonellum sp.]
MKVNRNKSDQFQTKYKKPGKKSTITQALAWEAVQRDPTRYTKIQCVYSFLLKFQDECFSRRQLEEKTGFRASSLTSIINSLHTIGLIGIEKQDVCEYTGMEVYFYYAIDPMSEPQKSLF